MQDFNKRFKYFSSRFIAVFLIGFIYQWAINILYQLSIFLGTYNFITEYLWWIVGILVIYIGFIIFNLIAFIYNKNELTGFCVFKKNIPDFETWMNEVISSEGSSAFYQYKFRNQDDYIFNFVEKELTVIDRIRDGVDKRDLFKKYFKTLSSWRFSEEIYKIEKQKENYSFLLIVLLLLSLFVFKGNPIIKNYNGLYKTYEVNDRGMSSFDYDRIIVSKDLTKIMIFQIEHECEENEDCTVSKRGYVFEEAGVFFGFDTHDILPNYFVCMGYALIERLIHTCMYFMLPFLGLILMGNLLDSKSRKLNAN